MRYYLFIYLDYFKKYSFKDNSFTNFLCFVYLKNLRLFWIFGIDCGYFLNFTLKCLLLYNGILKVKNDEKNIFSAFIIVLTTDVLTNLSFVVSAK